MTTSAEEIKALPTAHFVDWLERYAGSLRYGDRPTNGNDIAFLEVARRLSEVEGALKKAIGMVEHAIVPADWEEDEEKAKAAQAVWDADVASLRAALGPQQ